MWSGCHWNLLQKWWLAGCHGTNSGVSGVRTSLQQATGERPGVLIRENANIYGTFVSRAPTFPLRPSGGAGRQPGVASRAAPPAPLGSGGKAQELVARQDKDTAQEGTGTRSLPANRDLPAPALVREAAGAPLDAGTESAPDPFGTGLPTALRGPALPCQLRLERLGAPRIDREERSLPKAIAARPALLGFRGGLPELLAGGPARGGQPGQGKGRRAGRRGGRGEKGAPGAPASCGIQGQLGALLCRRTPLGVPLRSPVTGRLQDGTPLLNAHLLRLPCKQAPRPGPLPPSPCAAARVARLPPPAAASPPPAPAPCSPRTPARPGRSGGPPGAPCSGPQACAPQPASSQPRHRPAPRPLRSGARGGAAFRKDAAGTCPPGAGRGASAGAIPSWRERREPASAAPRSGGRAPSSRGNNARALDTIKHPHELAVVLAKGAARLGPAREPLPLQSLLHRRLRVLPRDSGVPPVSGYVEAPTSRMAYPVPRPAHTGTRPEGRKKTHLSSFCKRFIGVKIRVS